MRTRTLTWSVGLVAAVALAAAGCGGGSGNGGGGGGSTARASGSAGGGQAETQSLTMSIGAEPPSLDPGLAVDTTSSNVLLNIMDPLVKLDPKTLQPQPNLAQSWNVNGKTVTLHLRHDGRWTNGDPVTAKDFVWSWLRELSPQLGADYAYQFFGIKGAQAYNSCKPASQDCKALRRKVGVKAVDDYTLRITLVTPEPWFVQQLAHHSFLAVNEKAVQKYGSHWTEAKNIVTDGPFRLTAWKHDAYLTLRKWDGWRDASDVTLQKVRMNIISDGTTAERAFDTGETDIDFSGLPTADVSRLKQQSSYAQYPALGTYYYGFNLKKITDVNQRRAMTLAIDRKSIVENVTQQGQVPADAMTPKGMPGFDVIDQGHAYIAPTAELDKAKALMAKVANPVTDIDLYYNNAPGHKEIAVAIQAQWQQLGLNVTLHQQEWAQFLQFLGPPPNDAVDVYRNGWIADFVDDINFLELFTCDSGNNYTNFCNERYDKLVDKARHTQDDQARYKLYKKLEDMLTGPKGEMVIAPIYWYTSTALEKPWVKDSFFISPLYQYDLTKVVVQQH